MKRITLAVAGLAAIALVSSVQVAHSHNPVTTTVLFNREVAAIFNTKCVQCHAEDGMAMSLQTHAQARPWAIAIKEEILARRMPPWPAERGYGAFANDGGLTPRELEFLISWIDGGVPEGDGKPPEFQDHSGHWMLGQPDGVFTAVLQQNGEPPAGVTRYLVDPGFQKETFVRGLDLKVADKRSARAAFFSVSGTGQYLGGWTPWHFATDFPAGAAFRLPAGARIAVEVHHSPATPPAQPPTVGVYLATDAANVLEAMRVAGEAAPGQRRVRVSEHLHDARTIVGLRVELGPGGKSVEINARRPDGVFEPILFIKNYRADWQVPFVLKTPLVLPAGSTIHTTSYFDDTATASARSTVHLVGHQASGAAPATASPSAAPAHVH